MFGGVITTRHEHETCQAMIDRHPGFDPNPFVQRDRALVEASRRWSGSPLRPPVSRRYVPGDVAAIRYAIASDDITDYLAATFEPDRESTAGPPTSVMLAGCALRSLYAAVPYYVDLPTLASLVDCQVPTDDEVAGLRLPHATVGIYFSGDIEIPAELIAADNALWLLDRRYGAALERDDTTISADDAPASRITGPLLGVARREPVALCGLILHTTADGHLDDYVLWLTNVDHHVTAPRRGIYGQLSRSTLRYVAINLACAIAWGRWTPPDTTLELPDDSTSRDFRAATRTGTYRRREPRGAAIGVRVLDTNRTIRHTTTTNADGTHASPITHLRKRHWQRYRVGARDHWHYERRLIDPIVVNPGHTDNRLTVYRLPPPPL